DVPPPVELTAVDNCDGDITVSPSAVVTPGDCANQFTMVRTWIFTDVCGNTSSVSQTINVNDDTAPVAPTAPADLNLQCASDVPPPFDLTAVDNCDGDITVSPSAVVTPGDCANQFTMVRTWTFTDVCGNTSSVSQTIIVNDDTAPVAPTAPAELNLQCASDVPDIVELTAVDNCDGDITVSPTTVTIFGPCNNKFSQVRTWTFTDVCGNTSSVSQTINVNDDTPPEILCPSDVVLNFGPNLDTSPDATGGATATDNCGGVTVTFNDVITPGNCDGNYTITRTWTATDSCGNTSNCDQLITVGDDSPPTITCPADVYLECAEDLDTSLSATGVATAIDSGDPNPTITFSDVVTVGNCAGNYVITRTWTATDNCGNMDECVQLINVTDTTPPNVIDNCPTAADFGFADVQCQTELPTGDEAEQALVQNNLFSFFEDNCSGIAV
ncbi:MAG: gliding motility-associated C-terminal domain-containing protein, partial [Algicola sp.]|nr:gliding motility-associated C-terminal domain-containing protein [Algicola sp.]